MPPEVILDDRFKKAQSVKAGSTLSLQANFSGVPEPRIEWTLAGKALPVSEAEVVTSQQTTSLRVRGCRARHSGVYCVSATNDVGSASCDIEVTVTGKRRS